MKYSASFPNDLFKQNRLSDYFRVGRFQLRAFLFVSLTTVAFNGNRQSPVKYDVFEHQPFNTITLPKPAILQPVSSITNAGRQNQSSSITINPLVDIDRSIEDQNKRLIQQQNLSNPQQVIQQAAIERSLMEDEFYRKQIEWLNKTKSYREAFNNLLHQNPDSFSLIRAQFDVENAYLDNKFSYDDFLAGVKSRAELVKQILKREHLNNKNDLALNYGIQQLYQHPNSYYNKKTGKNTSIPQIKYDFNDYNGEKDLSNVFTEKLMRTGKGQCLSMPRLYLMIAEQLGAKAWLSLAPQHTYIQFIDGRGRLMNFETTNGNLTSSTWLAQSGFITAKAVKNKMYLDTLSHRQLFAQCLTDLLYGYLEKCGVDGFSGQILSKIFQIDPNNLRAQIIDANIKREFTFQAINAAGKPKEQDLPKYPQAYKAYLDMKSAIDKVDNQGYQDMSPEAYQKWLRSIEQEKKRQSNKELRGQMQRQIQMLKQSKPTLQSKPKG